MTRAADPTMYWAVLARPSGEVLTAEAQSPGLHLGLLGVPPGFGANEAEGWLYDVMGVAHESSPAPPGSRPIPALLHHALTGLLFSHGELWDRAGVPRPCSFAFAHTVHEVGFGWVGDAEITLWVDGEPRMPEWVRVRDEAGREALAWSIPSNHSVQVRILWRVSPARETAAGAEVEAVWTAAEGLGPDATVAPTPPVIETVAAMEYERPGALEVHSVPVPEPALGPTGHSEGAFESFEARAQEDARAAAPESGAREDERAEDAAPDNAPAGGGSPISRWLRRWFSWFTGGGKESGGEPDDRSAPETEAIPISTAVATTGDASPIVPDLIPPTPEPATVTWSAEPAAPHAKEPATAAPRVWRVMPEHIPPSPEPAELTDRAVLEPSDPHMIELPPPRHAVAARSTAGEILSPPSSIGVPIGAGPALAPAVLTPEKRETPAEPAAVVAAPTPVVAAPTPVVAAPTPVVAAPTPVVAVPTPVVPPVAVAAAPPSVVPPTSRPGDGAPPRMAAAVERVPPPAETPAPTEAVVAYPEPVPAVSPARAPRRTVPPQRPAWPSPQQLARPPRVPVWRRPWAWAVAVMALFVGGWLVGAMQDTGHPRDAAGRGALGRALHALGLGGPRFTVNVNSRPPGAWISVDGKTLTLRTPTALELTPGEHTLGLSFADLGGATYTVRGLKGERVPLDATLWGALEVFSPDEVGIVGVAVNGEPRGFAPLRVDSLTPGVHEVRFSGPGMASWGQTVDIRVGETKDLLARATPSPASGVLQVQASFTDEQGSQPLKGGQVWIDGEPRGITPLTLDLPRGPHSVRLVYKGQQAPIQVIDLPGGNQRFAVFEFGLDLEVPQLTADVPPRIPRDRPVVVSAFLAGVRAGELREMWLHAQIANGPWRRYAMTLLKAPEGAVGVAVFPPSAFDAQGRARYYLSAQYGQGDESFTEIRTVQLEKSTGR